MKAKLKQFLLKNKSMWKKSSYQGNDRYLLVDLKLEHAGNLNTNLIIAKQLEKIIDCKSIALIQNDGEKDIYQLVESYQIKDKIYLYDKKFNILKKFYFAGKALYYFSLTLKNKDLINLKIDGLEIGHNVYDSIAHANGRGTVDNYGKEVFVTLYNAIYWIHVIKHILNSYNIIAIVQTELSYLIGGVISKMAISKGITIYTRVFAPTNVAVKKCTNMADLDVWPGKPRKELFEYNLKHNKEVAINWAEIFLDNRTSGKLGKKDWDAKNAYKMTKKMSDTEIIKLYCLEEWNDVILILPHVLIDAPHCFKKIIHKDYYTWLVETLNIASQLPNVKWLIKPHPSEQYYNTTLMVEEIVRRYSKYKNIELVSASISGISFLNVIRAIITLNGTAAMEYSCLGIPSITAGDSSFSDAGFCIESFSKEEYESRLKNIANIDMLIKSKIERAKVFLYTYEKSNKIRMPYIPPHSTHNNINIEQFYHDMLILQAINDRNTNNNFSKYLSNIVKDSIS